MNLHFRSDYYAGSNTAAIYNVAKQNYCCTYKSKDFSTSDQPQEADVGITNNGRHLRKFKCKLAFNTHHGKGFMAEGGPEPGINITIASSETERSVYISNGYRPEDVLLTGRPRVDPLYDTNEHEQVRFDYLKSVGLDPSKKTILYAPTYDRSVFGMGTKGFWSFPGNLKEDVEATCEFVRATNDYNVIIRLHRYFVRDHKHTILPYIRRLFGKNVHFCDNASEPNSIPAMISSDVAITDFSSLVFDYLALDRPIVFLEPNAGWQYTDRWFCNKQERFLFGTVFNSGKQFEVLEDLESLTSDKLDNGRAIAHTKYLQFSDGNNSERAVEAIVNEFNRRYN